MANRYMLNETACPIPLQLLALLLRSNEVRIAEIVEQLPVQQRASLAAYCFSKCHMRSLSFEIAAQCDERSLRTSAGPAGEILFEQSRSRAAFDVEPMQSRRAKVTLARAAA